MTSSRRHAVKRYDLRRVRWIVFVGLLSFATGIAWGCWKPEIRIAQSPISPLHDTALNTWLGCLQEAAYVSGVDPALFHAIVTVESGEHPYTFGWFDRTGVRKVYKARSYRDAVAHFDKLERERIRFDVGLAQVNSRNLTVLERRMGISPIRALDPCTNLRLAAIILREQIQVHGPTWRAVAGYNGALTYVQKVHRVYCSHVPDGASCHDALPLPHLLCEPLPYSQTERYYRVFFRTLA